MPACFLPSETLHNHTNQYTDRLSQPFCAAWVLGGEKVIDGWFRLKLAHNACQGRPVVVNLRFLHTAVSVFTLEKVEYNVERLLGIIEHVGKGPALTVLKKIVTGDDHPRPHLDYLVHAGLPSDRFSGHLTFI
jgi:hypothetical protein